MKWFIILTFSLPLLAQSDFVSQVAELRDILMQYRRIELVSSYYDNYQVTESYDLDAKPSNFCELVFVHHIEYSYNENFNNDRKLTTRYYVDLSHLESSPIIESLEEKFSRVVPLRSVEKMIQAYVRTTYASGHVEKSLERYQLVMIKFKAPLLREQFGATILEMIQSCRGYL